MPVSRAHVVGASMGGHAFMSEEPEAFNAAVQSFLMRID
jgi:pimeloyl-ACP methyl ester carboxylesterase